VKALVWGGKKHETLAGERDPTGKTLEKKIGFSTNTRKDQLLGKEKI